MWFRQVEPHTLTRLVSLCGTVCELALRVVGCWDFIFVMG